MTTLTTLPPAPQRSDPANFAAKADAWVNAIESTFTPEINLIIPEINALTSTAVTSANTATTKALDATNAAALAVPAAATATQKLIDIEALYDQFDDKYLGSKSSDPTLDNDGNALQDGAFYINSVSGALRAYTVANGWVQGISAVAGVSSVNGVSGAVTGVVTLTGTQTLTNKTIEAASFTNGYTEEVYAPVAGSAFTVDLANGSIQGFTTNANTTITLPAVTAGKSFQLQIAFGGAHTLTFAGGTLVWGTTPTFSGAASKTDVVNFTANVAGTKWIGAVFSLGSTS